MKPSKFLFTLFLAANLFLFSTVHAVTHNSVNSYKKTHTLKTAHSDTVNLNTADVKTILTLKGIGIKKAEAIVAYRKGNGKFDKVEDLVKVKGINEKTLERLLKDNPNRIKVRE